MSGYFSANMGSMGYFNSLYSSEIICRVDFDGTTYAANTPFADTKINQSLTGKTTAQLLSLANNTGGFTGSNDQSIYRKAGAAGATRVKLAKVINTSLVYCVLEVNTGLTSSTRTIGVITTDNPTAKIIPLTVTSSLTSNNILVDYNANTGGTIGYSFSPFLVASGQDIELIIGAEAATVLAAGSINVVLRVAQFETKDRLRDNRNNTSSNRRFGPIIPIY